MEPSGYAERPDYRVDILRRRNQVTVRHADVVIARSESALLVDEQDHGLVFYLPQADVDLSQLVAIDHPTRCPYKGVADHWRLTDGDDPVAWSYRHPYPQVVALKGYIAFYQDRLSVEIGVATPAVVGYSS